MKRHIAICMARPAAPMLVSLLLLTACASSGPQKRVPDAAHLSALPSGIGADGVQAGAAPALWWRELGDADLEQLVQRAWHDNHDLRIAAARLDAAGEYAVAARASRWPSFELQAQGGRARASAIETHDGRSRVAEPVQWDALLSWELDLFGRVRQSIAVAQASVDEQAALRDDVRRLILAEVVYAYVELRGAQQLQASLREQLDNQAGTVRLVREREQAGRAAPAERMRAEAQMRLAGARLPSLATQERAARNRLATLTGQRLDASEIAALDRSAPLALPRALVTDEPARLLLRRPDLRAAERALAAAEAREGMALADRFPRVSLAALFGASGVAGDWTGGDNRRWQGGAALGLPLFDGGARRARVRAAGAEVEAARAGYEKVLAFALEDADNAISRWSQLRRRHAELEQAHELGQESARLARLRYQEGGESLLGVLEAERIALATQEELISAQRDLAIATARSYVAMAGGFDLP
ncbi:efflux transporter outer membrane subunit [Pseudoduganella plicata]|uniref:Multidrug efflux outer membrane protein OprN n=1 Tax=Pseudoduganella plicata TaxID=321984 RepID=A0A4P7BFH1_9BURK|nr:TolC family protein [Pseudoduganella plicata]QBQ37506.1 TolC family protein [Pseudoduganella plicata]GGY90773.1 multidrug efflux outer membrane protein OprN [Pseudoduganella plicata]